MFNLLVILILITASLLILAVLIQSSKKEGLGSVYFGGDKGASQLIGVRKTSDLLEQITWGLVIVLFTCTLATSLVLNKKDSPDILPTSPNINRAQKYSVLPATKEQAATPSSEAP